MSVRAWIGTSGYSFDEWKGNFYPEKLAAKDRLKFYAERLETVEINNTFYRMPTEKLLAGWWRRSRRRSGSRSSRHSASRTCGGSRTAPSP